MSLAPSRTFPSVQEGDDPFLALWPHRYDYLWAEHPILTSDRVANREPSSL
jgi:hypothetical protein